MITKAEFLGIKVLDETTTDAVAAGGDDTVTITPPEGQIYQMVDCAINIPDPAGSSAGTHTLVISTIKDTFSTYQGKLGAVSTTGNDIKMGNYTGIVADSAEYPSALSDQLYWLTEKIWASPDAPILVKYDNDTDVQQAGSRIYRFLFKVYAGVDL